MSTLDEIGDYLQAQGLGTLQTDLFLGERPEQPDDILFVTPYAGDAPAYVQDSRLPILEYPQLQVAVRARAYANAEDRILRAWYALAGVTNAFLGTNRYLSIRPNSSPGLMGRDPQDRVTLYFNVTIEKEVPVGP